MSSKSLSRLLDRKKSRKPSRPLSAVLRWHDPDMLLDAANVPAAALAFGMRKLKKSYTGNALKIRRASDPSVEADVGFASNNKVTAASPITITSGTYDGPLILGEFMSGVYGYITTWYDQSGNSRTLTQATADNQPMLVYGGSFLGVPTFDGSNDYMDSNYEHESSSDDFTWCAVCKADAADQADGLMTDLRTFNQGCEVATASSNWNFKVEQHDLNTSKSVSTSDQIILVSYDPSGSDNQLLRKDGAGEDRDEDENILASQRSKFSIGCRRSPVDYSYALNSPWAGTISEVITWESKLTAAQMTAVEENLAAYHNIILA